MKYNISEIMKRAWEIKRQDSEYIFSECLKMAWRAEKYHKALKKYSKEIDGLEGLMAPEFYTRGDELHAAFTKVKNAFIESLKAQVKATFTGRSYKERKEARRTFMKAARQTSLALASKDEVANIYFVEIVARAYEDGMYELEH